MAKKKKAPSRSAAQKKPKARVSKVMDQVKEPLSLLQTLKDEGLANAITLISMASTVASGAARNFRAEALRPQLKEVVSSLGFALRDDLERLEGRVEELEQQLSEREYEKLKAADGEE